MTKKKEEVDSGVLVWHNLALLHGWSELAKKVETLGTVVTKNGTGPSVLTLPYRAPHVEFYEKDIELMRKAVAVYDEKRKEKP